VLWTTYTFNLPIVSRSIGRNAPKLLISEEIFKEIVAAPYLPWSLVLNCPK